MAGKAKAPGVEQGGDGLEINVPYPTEGLPAPVAINYTRIDRVGTEVQLAVGYIDLSPLVQLIAQGKRGEIQGQASVKVEVLHRLVFSAEAFARLKGAVDEISAQLANVATTAAIAQPARKV